MNIIKSNLKWKSPLIPLNSEKVIFLIIHHIDAKLATPEQIHQWHLERGWKGAAYNEYIRKDGTVVILRGDNIGGHTANMNSKSYGIAIEGNYETEKEMPAAQFNSLVDRVKYNQGRFKNLVEIAPHKKFTPTSCPGKYFPFEKMMMEVEKPNELETIYDAIEVLQRNGIINSPDYWRENALIGESVKGEYAAALILKMAEKLRG